MSSNDNITIPARATNASARAHSHPLPLDEYDKSVACMIDQDTGTLVEPVADPHVDGEDQTAEPTAGSVTHDALDIIELRELRDALSDPDLTVATMTAETLEVLVETMRRQPSLALGYLGTITDQPLREHLVQWLVETERERGGVLADYTVWDTVLDLESGTVPSAEEAGGLREVLDEEMVEWAKAVFADADALRRESEQLAQESGTKPDAAVQQAFSIASDAVRETTGGPDWGAGSVPEQQLEAMVQAERERLRAVPEVVATVGGEAAPLLPPTTAMVAEEPVTAQTEQAKPEDADNPETYIPDPVGVPSMHPHIEDTDTDEYLDAVFCTPMLRELRERAEASGVSPNAALTYFLATTSDLLPPHIHTAFDPARPLTLNTAWVLLGPSGMGKGESGKLIERQVEFRAPDGTPVTAHGGWTQLKPSPRRPVGSGPATAAEYVGEVQTDPLTGVLNRVDGAAPKGAEPSSEKAQVFEARWIEFTEVGKLNKLMEGSGSTMGEELKNGVTCEALGSNTKTNAALLDGGNYRFTLTVHGQDDKMGLLLEDLTGGLAQRLLFADAMPTTAFGMSVPGKLIVTLPLLPPGNPRDSDGRTRRGVNRLPEWVPTSVAPRILAENALWTRMKLDHARRVRRAARAGERPPVPHLSAHPMSTHTPARRLIVATLGALSHGQTDVTEFWWDWAGLVIGGSVAMRRVAMQASRAETRKKSRTKGTVRAHEKVGEQTEESRIEAETETRAAEWVASWVEKQGGAFFTDGDIKRAARSDLRKHVLPALEDTAEGLGLVAQMRKVGAAEPRRYWVRKSAATA